MPKRRNPSSRKSRKSLADGYHEDVRQGVTHVQALILAAIHDAVESANADLRDAAAKMRFFNETKKQIRAELTRARGLRDGAGPGRSDGRVTRFKAVRFDTFPTFNRYGNPRIKKVSAGFASTRGQLEAHIRDLEMQLADVGDDATLANIDLQNMLQRQQQTIQMLSNISKTLHDTAMAIIRNIE